VEQRGTATDCHPKIIDEFEDANPNVKVDAQ
jgi:hypothetical protein